MDVHLALDKKILEKYQCLPGADLAFVKAAREVILMLKELEFTPSKVQRKMSASKSKPLRDSRSSQHIVERLRPRRQVASQRKYCPAQLLSGSSRTLNKLQHFAAMSQRKNSTSITKKNKRTRQRREEDQFKTPDQFDVEKVLEGIDLTEFETW